MEDDIEITETPEEIAEKTRLELKRLRVEARKNRKLKKKAAAIDKKKEIIRNEFIREMKYGQTTYERWEKDWIQMMEKLNHVDLKNEVEEVLGEFRSMLDSKETLIERLKNDLKTAQEYMQFAVQGHLEVINYLKSIYIFMLLYSILNLPAIIFVETFEIIMKSIKGFYEDESFKMLEMYRKDYNFHKSVDLCRQNFFENIIIGSNDLSVAAHDQLHKEFVSRSLACTTFNVEKLEDFRDESVNSMKRLFDQMRETVSFFRSTSATPPRIRRYMKWIRAQVTDEKEINQDNIDWDKLQSLQITLMRQRNKLELQSMVELENLQQEKELFRQYFATMRRIVEGELERDEKKTRMFSYGSHKTVEVCYNNFNNYNNFSFEFEASKEI